MPQLEIELRKGGSEDDIHAAWKWWSKVVINLERMALYTQGNNEFNVSKVCRLGTDSFPSPLAALLSVERNLQWKSSFNRFYSSETSKGDIERLFSLLHPERPFAKEDILKMFS